MPANEKVHRIVNYTLLVFMAIFIIGTLYYFSGDLSGEAVKSAKVVDHKRVIFSYQDLSIYDDGTYYSAQKLSPMRSSNGCGDFNQNDELWIDDLIFLVTYMFGGGDEPSCYPISACSDIDGSGTGPDIADVTHFASYIAGSGMAPLCECSFYECGDPTLNLLENFCACQDDVYFCSLKDCTDWMCEQNLLPPEMC